MVSTFEIIIAIAVAVFFAVEGFSGNVALNVILLIAGLGSLSLAGATFYRSRRS